MSWTEAVEDRWGGDHGTVRLIVRAVGNAAFGVLLWRQGAFGGPLWVGVITALAVALAFALLLIRTRRRFDRLAVALTLAMIVAAIAVNPYIEDLGSVYCVIGGVMLVGQPEVPVRIGIPVAVAVGAALISSNLLAGDPWGVVLGNGFGVAAVVLLGLNRRQRIIRHQAELALADRSRELEQRNAELLTQTVRAGEEAAKAAALEERGRIARDLHDLLAHALGGLVVQLDAAGAELERGHLDQAAARLRSSRALAVDGLREARAAVQELRTDPHDRGPVDLVDAVRGVLHGPVGLQLGIELEVVGAPRPVPAGVADALAAVAREGTTNLNKHAPSGPGTATLVFGPGWVELELVNAMAPRDSAAAAPPTSPTAELIATGAGAGLPGLRDRLALLGGTLRAGPEGSRWVLGARCPAGTDRGDQR